jgi:hypothetical protein
MKTSPPPFRFAVVVWADSCVALRECDESELPDVATMVSAGFLVREAEDSVTLALERSVTCGHWRSALTIPRVCIKSMSTVTLPETKRDRGKGRGRP